MTPTGTFRATWAGEVPPQSPAWIDVELSVESVLKWQEDVFLAPGADLGVFASDSSGAVIVGEVEAVDADGVIALALLSSVVLVEIAGVPTHLPLRAVLRLDTDHLELHPTGL